MVNVCGRKPYICIKKVKEISAVRNCCRDSLECEWELGIRGQNKCSCSAWKMGIDL